MASDAFIVLLKQIDRITVPQSSKKNVKKTIRPINLVAILQLPERPKLSPTVHNPDITSNKTFSKEQLLSIAQMIRVASKVKIK